jgi:ATP-dependent Clp protease ATP-binding subunit ClpA
MFDRFTDRARKVMSFARQEAERFNHDYIGTEHILLGLVKEGSGVAAEVLKILGVNLEKVRAEVEKLVKPAPAVVTVDQLPFTPSGKKVLEFAIDETHALHNNYLGTEHLLLGLLHEREGIAAQVLAGLGLKLDDVRNALVAYLGEHPRPSGHDASSGEGVEQRTRALAMVIHADPALLRIVASAKEAAYARKRDTPAAEDLLMALLQDDKGFAAQVLVHFGLKVEDVRNEILRRMGLEGPPPGSKPS